MRATVQTWLSASPSLLGIRVAGRLSVLLLRLLVSGTSSRLWITSEATTIRSSGQPEGRRWISIYLSIQLSIHPSSLAHRLRDIRSRSRISLKWWCNYTMDKLQVDHRPSQWDKHLFTVPPPRFSVSPVCTSSERSKGSAFWFPLPQKLSSTWSACD